MFEEKLAKKDTDYHLGIKRAVQLNSEQEIANNDRIVEECDILRGQYDPLDQKMNDCLVCLSNYEDVPEYEYSHTMSKWVEVNDFDNDFQNNNNQQKTESSLFTEPTERITNVLKRYSMIRSLMEKSNYYIFEHEKNKMARIKNNDHGFRVSAEDDAHSIRGYILLHELGSLNGRHGKFNICGIVFKHNEKYHMQDKLNRIVLDLTRCEDTLGFVLDSFFIIATGSVEYNTFYVEKFMQPIVNKKEVHDTLAVDIKDPSGAKTKFVKTIGKLTKVSATDDNKTKADKLTNLKMTQELQRELGIFNFNKTQKFFLSGNTENLVFKNSQELSNEFPISKKIMVLNNVTLDCTKVMNNLEILIETFSIKRPLMLVLCGPFLSSKEMNSTTAVNNAKQSINNFYN